MTTRAVHLLLVMNNHAIMHHRHGRLAHKLAGLVPLWGEEGDVIGLPLPRRTTGIYLGRKLAIQRGALAIGVTNIVVGVEHLHLITAVQEHTAIATALTFALHHLRRGEFQVQLD